MPSDALTRNTHQLTPIPALIHGPRCADAAIAAIVTGGWQCERRRDIVIAARPHIYERRIAAAPPSASHFTPVAHGSTVNQRDLRSSAGVSCIRQRFSG